MRTLRTSCVLGLVALAWAGPGGAAPKLLAENLAFNSIEPCRLFDTSKSAEGPLLAGETRSFDVVGAVDLTVQGGESKTGCGLPGWDKGLPQVQAVVVHYLAKEPAESGALTAWASDSARPENVTMDFTAGSLAPNLGFGTVTPVRRDFPGQDISVHATEQVDLVAQVVGYYTTIQPVAALGAKPGAGSKPGTGIEPLTDIPDDLYVAGKAGIGTSTPNHQLRVVGGPAWTSYSWTGSVELDNASAIGWNANAANQRFGIGQTNGGLLFFRTASDPGTTDFPPSYDVILSDAGNVGIGTTAPQGKLDVNGDIYSRGSVLLADGSAGVPSIAWKGDSNTGIFHPPGNSNILAFTTASSERMRIDSGGQIEIGTFNNYGSKVSIGEDGFDHTLSVTTSHMGGTAVYAYSEVNNSWSLWARRAPNSQGGYAGYFSGAVAVTGTLTKPGGSFKIDHPLDPAHKYLSHSFVESPDMMNLYNGNVVLDRRGEAVVKMPDWFNALNRDFRYQLTAIGGPGPDLYVAEEIANNRFKIAGGKPGMKVSWQVSGIRQDAWANANRIPVEEAKPADEKGTYLHPELFGQSEEKSVEWAQHPELRRHRDQQPETPPPPR